MTTHWKKLTNTDYIGAYSLEPKQELTVMIEKVEKRLVKGADGKQEHCIVADLKGQKPMILNRTNCKTISKVYGTPYIEEWAGKSITLYAAKVKAFGELVEALRVKDVIPNLPELTPAHEKWAGAKEAIKAGTYTIEQLKKHFKITPENESKLQN
jgi:hypothetical protein